MFATGGGSSTFELLLSLIQVTVSLAQLLLGAEGGEVGLVEAQRSTLILVNAVSSKVCDASANITFVVLLGG